MKKLLGIVLVLLFLIITGCNNSSATGDDEGTAVKYIKNQGYEIITQNGDIQKYTLEKSKLQTMQYQQICGVQKIDTDKYLGKEISTYCFTVEKHPLEKIYKVKTNIFIMFSNGKLVGGYSFPNEKLFGVVYSLDGKTVEEVTGLSYEQWRDNWEKKYSN
jgi:hypothetical protein